MAIIGWRIRRSTSISQLKRVMTRPSILLVSKGDLATTVPALSDYLLRGEGFVPALSDYLLRGEGFVPAQPHPPARSQTIFKL